MTNEKLQEALEASRSIANRELKKSSSISAIDLMFVSDETRKALELLVTADCDARIKEAKDQLAAL